MSNIYKQSDHFVKLSTKNLLWGVMGIMLGLITNNVVIYFVEKYKITNNKLKILLHLFLCAIILSFIQIYLSNYFGWTWQNLTPGLFFVSFYFGVQYNIFTLLQNNVF